MADALSAAGIIAGFSVRQPDGAKAGGVAVRVLRTGAVTVLALERDPDATAGTVELRLAAPASIRDLRAPGGAITADRIAVTLDPVAPSLLALSPAPLPGPTIAGPAEAKAGEAVVWRLALSAPDSASHALRVRLIDPGGQLAGAYSGVRVLDAAAAEWRVAFAPDAAAGRWRIEVTDILSGKTASATLVLTPR
jgi:hypothetical protein